MNINDLTCKQARGLVYDDSPGIEKEDGTFEPYFEVVERKIIDTTRWSTVHEMIVKETQTGRHFLTSYSQGATEGQDEQPFEYSEPDWVEVSKVEKVIEVWERV